MPSSGFRIAVLSDHHIDCENYPDSWNLARSSYKAAIKENVDHIVLAGDVFDTASAMERDKERVSKYLKRLGLWHRDRLSIVIGNHDIFEVSGRTDELDEDDEGQGILRRVLRRIPLKTLLKRAQSRYDSFCEWADGVVASDDRLNEEDDLYPFVKKLKHVLLLAMDTTERNTMYSAYGRWSGDDEDLVRKHIAEVDTGNQLRRILAIHNSPHASRKFSKKESFKEAMSWVQKRKYPELGFPSSSKRKLERFASEMGLDAILCGHIHSDREFNWKMGTGKRRTDVHVVGRTGGMAGEKPCFGVMNVPRQGKVAWKTVRF